MMSALAEILITSFCEFQRKYIQLWENRRSNSIFITKLHQYTPIFK